MSVWQFRPLGQVCKTTSGGTPSRSHPEYFGGGIPWIKSGDLTDSDVLRCEERITEDALRHSSAKIFGKGTVLIAMYGATVGKLGMLGVEAATNQAVCGISPPDDLDRWFLFYFLLSQRKKLIEQSTGGAQPNISQKIVRELLVPVPPVEEQRRIVDLLSRAEGIVRLRREAEKKAAELIPAIFLDMFGDPATNPKGWQTQRLDKLCDLVRGSSPRPQGDPRYFGGPVPRLMIADITRDGVYVRPAIDSLTDEGAKKSRPMKKGEVVMAVSGAVGLPAILDVDACIHDGFVGFRSLDPCVSPEFFYNYLSAYRRHSVGQAVGATFQNLKTDQIREWVVPTPPQELQEHFQNIAGELKGLCVQQSTATAKAQSTFDALLSKVFSDDTH
jgi:type I restriction enzyme S subunit